jgi:hypothetical protein
MRIAKKNVDPIALFLQEPDEEGLRFEKAIIATMFDEGEAVTRQERREEDFIGGRSQISTMSCDGSSNSIVQESAPISGLTLSNKSRSSCSISPDVGLTVAPSSESLPNPPGPPNSI